MTEAINVLQGIFALPNEVGPSSAMTTILSARADRTRPDTVAHLRSLPDPRLDQPHTNMPSIPLLNPAPDTQSAPDSRRPRWIHTLP